MTFTKAVTLDVTGGTPQLELTVGDSTRTATCATATGTQLTCRYVVAEGIEGEIGVAANKLTLNGGVLTGPNEPERRHDLRGGRGRHRRGPPGGRGAPDVRERGHLGDGTKIVARLQRDAPGDFRQHARCRARFTVMAGTSAATLDGAPSVSGTTVTLTLSKRR